jgi:hypothetical protein
MKQSCPSNQLSVKTFVDLETRSAFVAVDVSAEDERLLRLSERLILISLINRVLRSDELEDQLRKK